MTKDQKTAKQFVKEYIELVKKYGFEIEGECFGLAKIPNDMLDNYVKTLTNELMEQASMYKEYKYEK